MSRDEAYMPFVPALEPPRGERGPALWFVFRGSDLLVLQGDEGLAVPLIGDPSDLGLAVQGAHYFGSWNGQGCYAAEITPETPPPDGMVFCGLRQLFPMPELFQVAGRAVQIVDWDRCHRFCGRCGARTQDKPQERAKLCADCNQVFYPRIAPAVIMAVVRDDRLLLASSRAFAKNFYSVLAGYVEPGETLEECVRREVLEEVGVRVKDIRYFGSQSWPFPNSLMIGFTARWAGGEIVVDGEEIAAAGWFTVDNLPRLPRSISISRQLIDWFVDRQGSFVRESGDQAR